MASSSCGTNSFQVLETMKKGLSHVILFVLLFVVPPSSLCFTGKGANAIRESILAGSWYPGAPQDLRAQLSLFFANVSPIAQISGKILGLIVPHAGYRYSGQVAAHAYKCIKGMNIRRVILIGPSHRIPFRGISVNMVKGYRTPLGVVPVDQDFGRSMMEYHPAIKWIRAAHRVEHSLEIQLPFLQSVLEDFKIVPIVMGVQDLGTCSILAKGLSQLMEATIKTHGRELGPPGDTLLVASTDLSHYHCYDRAVTMDTIFIKHVEKMDPHGLYGALANGKCEACGGGAVVSLLLSLKALGARPIILKYANSGDVTGEKESVVGYMASVIVKSSDRDLHQK